MFSCIRAATFLPLAAVLPSACSAEGPQSTLAPVGPAAEAIARSGWLMFFAALLIWMVVVALVLLAMRRARGMSTIAANRLIVGGGLVVPVLLLGALLAFGTLTSDKVTGRADAIEHVVEVTARQWQWDFVYLDADRNPVARSTDTLAMPLGAMVEFRIDSADVVHSFWIPRLGGKVDAIPGRTNRLRLRADAAVPIRGQCAEYCGLDHTLMAFDVQVLQPEAYADWLRTQAIDRGGLP